MKVLLSWSSGKDSAWALHLLNQEHPARLQDVRRLDFVDLARRR
jgi:diphthamide synthase (EF-2-diphthine--ammonia ligase)